MKNAIRQFASFFVGLNSIFRFRCQTTKAENLVWNVVLRGLERPLFVFDIIIYNHFRCETILAIYLGDDDDVDVVCGCLFQNKKARQ